MTEHKRNEINNLNDMTDDRATVQIRRLAQCLLNYIEQFGEKKQAFDVLRALATLTIDRIDGGKRDLRFTALNILTEAKISVSEGKSHGTRLSPLWVNLTNSILPERKLGIQDFAREDGHECYPWPEKEKTEGGYPSKYFLTSSPLPDSEIVVQSSVKPGQITYIRELTPEPSWWARSLLRSGYRLEGWRRKLFLAYGLVSLFATGIVLIMLWSLFAMENGSSLARFAKTIFISGGFISLLWLMLNPFVRLLDWRIIMAPTSLTALKETNVQMEIIRDSIQDSSSVSTIRLTRYASTCPICGAKIELAEGGREFPNRLVGRCKESPSEHLYSFDRVTFRGQSLR